MAVQEGLLLFRQKEGEGLLEGSLAVVGRLEGSPVRSPSSEDSEGRGSRVGSSAVSLVDERDSLAFSTCPTFSPISTTSFQLPPSCVREAPPEEVSAISNSMAKTLISSPTFLGTPLPARSRHHGLLHSLPSRRFISTTVKMSLHDIPPVHLPLSHVDFSSILTRAESVLYTLADAAVAVDAGAASSSTDAAAVQKSGGWFGFISDAMEFVLKIMKGGLEAVHVPYAYGFGH
ncbi:unnamed protein product [Linum tenue]|uniref:Uncharacterized protein n=1 Tax=Linum tenue TaxID=586396 RepID=A0AAV0HCH3_9ROSI|nr:unnamed protein product [Linum tenue]